MRKMQTLNKKCKDEIDLLMGKMSVAKDFYREILEKRFLFIDPEGLLMSELFKMKMKGNLSRERIEYVLTTGKPLVDYSLETPSKHFTLKTSYPAVSSLSDNIFVFGTHDGKITTWLLDRNTMFKTCLLYTSDAADE